MTFNFLLSFVLDHKCWQESQPRISRLGLRQRALGRHGASYMHTVRCIWDCGLVHDHQV